MKLISYCKYFINKKTILVLLICLFLSGALTSITINKLNKNGNKKTQLVYIDYDFNYPTSTAIFSLLSLIVLMIEIRFGDISKVRCKSLYNCFIEIYENN